jgi:hypothetical protein
MKRAFNTFLLLLMPGLFSLLPEQASAEQKAQHTGVLLLLS